MRFTVRAGSILGIPLHVHATFPLIFVAYGVAATIAGGWRAGVHAIVFSMAVFVCVVLHELGHCLQVRRYGFRVQGIILLPIGGLARMEGIPRAPGAEIRVAISGPLVNFGIAAILWIVIRLTGGDPLSTAALLPSLLLANLVLGIFNLIPAFPMDGGRILRALLATRLSYLRATAVARAIAQVIAIAFATLAFVQPTFIMLYLIGVFVFVGAIREEGQIRVSLQRTGER